jgi:hypothetical protein
MSYVILPVMMRMNKRVWTMLYYFLGVLSFFVFQFFFCDSLPGNGVLVTGIQFSFISSLTRSTVRDTMVCDIL